jgi:hypothetical protein
MARVRRSSERWHSRRAWRAEELSRAKWRNENRTVWRRGLTVNGLGRVREDATQWRGADAPGSLGARLGKASATGLRVPDRTRPTPVDSRRRQPACLLMSPSRVDARRHWPATRRAASFFDIVTILIGCPSARAAECTRLYVSARDAPRRRCSQNYPHQHTM